MARIRAKKSKIGIQIIEIMEFVKTPDKGKLVIFKV
jgi:hypothetical protein